MHGHTVMNREYRRGLSTYLCGDPVLRISIVKVYLHHLGGARQEVQDPFSQGGVQTQGPELNEELGGYYGDECCILTR